MNKREARERALSNTFTVEQLRKMIDRAARRGGCSRVNSAVSIGRACEVYRGALEGLSPNDIPAGMRRSHRGGMKPTPISLVITNILRDCA